jgi:hypothetical protein
MVRIGLVYSHEQVSVSVCNRADAYAYSVRGMCVNAVRIPSIILYRNTLGLKDGLNPLGRTYTFDLSNYITMIHTVTSPKGSTKDTAFQFKTPAHIVDFPNDPDKQALLEAAWNTNLNGFTQQAILGNPWTATNVPQATNYFNPITTPMDGASPTAIEWTAFPGRIAYYEGSVGNTNMLSLADTGYQTDGTTSFIPITKNPCTGGAAPSKAYGPYGPRGWQDEYCEWAVTHNSKGQITRIDFTCENPEYWNTLWSIDPQRVLELYQSTLDNQAIKLEDLILYDGGSIVYDPNTDLPCYNPLNKYNFGPQVMATGGGAMHLTSTPNTIQTELGLAATATPQRTCGPGNFNTLICCAQYGQPQRNSDPNIGGTVNLKVSQNNTATLTNPPGLYIQTPDFGGYNAPDGTDVSKFWTIKRGKEALIGDDGKLLPGNFILHAVFEVPASYGYTVSDITIGVGSNATPITYAGQVAQTMLMHIVASVKSQPAGPVYQCVGDPALMLPQPLQMFHAKIFKGMQNNVVPNPVKQPMTLLSNSTLIAPSVKQGSTIMHMVLVMTGGYAVPQNPYTWPTLVFDGPDLTAEVVAAQVVHYAIPGNSYPSDSLALSINLKVASNATKGLRAVGLKNKDVSNPVLMPAMLQVI